MGSDTWSEKNDNVSNILDFGNKINAETRLARWLNVNAGLRCQVYAVTDKVYNFLEQRARWASVATMFTEEKSDVRRNRGVILRRLRTQADLRLHRIPYDKVHIILLTKARNTRILG